MTSAFQPAIFALCWKHSRCRPCVTVKFTQQVMSYDPSTSFSPSSRSSSVPNQLCSFHGLVLRYASHSPYPTSHCAPHVYPQVRGEGQHHSPHAVMPMLRIQDFQRATSAEGFVINQLMIVETQTKLLCSMMPITGFCNTVIHFFPFICDGKLQ